MKHSSILGIKNKLCSDLILQQSPRKGYPQQPTLEKDINIPSQSAPNYGQNNTDTDLLAIINYYVQDVSTCFYQGRNSRRIALLIHGKAHI